jgi:GST-like protein
MIDLHYWPTPNGWKISIALEEMELPYRIVPVNIGRGDQFRPEFLAISPNNRMPAIVDHEPLGGGEPLAIFESGAILLYLAEKSGRFVPREVRARYEVTQWLFWQVGGLGPMLGQHGHFKLYAPEPIPYGILRYGNEATRLYKVLNERLEGRDYICGEYSVADMACWPWIVTWRAQGFDLEKDFPNVRAWYDRCKQRPALRRGYEVGRDIRTMGAAPPDEKTRSLLFSGIRPQDR